MSGRAESKRGVGTMFGPDVTRKFLERNNLEYVIRSHEVKPEGYEVSHDGKCITVFSAPNYCEKCFIIDIDTMGNKGTLRGDDLTPKFTSFELCKHDFVKFGMSHHNRAKQPAEDDYDPLDKLIKEAGCTDLQYKVETCIVEKQDWRQCQREIIEFRACMEKNMKQKNKT